MHARIYSSSDKISGGIAVLSHIYFDTFNIPVQAFLPDSVYSSGQWEFWKNVGYLTFRSKFYDARAIQHKFSYCQGVGGISEIFDSTFIIYLLLFEFKA